MQIRMARIGDLPELLDIYNDEVLHGVATLDIRPRTMEERRAWFYAHGTGESTGNRHHPLIVAEEEGKILGYASLSRYREKEAYCATAELSVYVAGFARGKGVASALLSEILRLARADEVLHTVVSVITSGNEASTRLHEKFGFEYCGTIREVGTKFGRLLGIDNYRLTV